MFPIFTVNLLVRGIMPQFQVYLVSGQEHSPAAIYLSPLQKDSQENSSAHWLGQEGEGCILIPEATFFWGLYVSLVHCRVSLLTIQMCSSCDPSQCPQDWTGLPIHCSPGTLLLAPMLSLWKPDLSESADLLFPGSLQPL